MLWKCVFHDGYFGFSVCQLDEERVDAGSKTETVGNTTFFGQIAHLIDTLHLSYTEVFEIIPYRNLLMMQRDKLHAVYGGQKVNRISGKELANRRKRNRYGEIILFNFLKLKAESKEEKLNQVGK